MTTTSDAAPPPPARATTALRLTSLVVGRGSGWRIVERNFLVYRKVWFIFITGFLEPLFYLLSIGIGVGHLVGSFEVHGEVVKYAEFVAPAMMAASAMNGAIIDATFNMFFRMKYQKLYDAILSTPISAQNLANGELTWCLMRGSAYSGGFLIVMVCLGQVRSGWAILAWPASVLVGFAFAGAGMALTTFMRSWQDFEYVGLALIPMTLFSGSFFPVGHYGVVGQWIVKCTPLYHGIELIRGLTLGTPHWSMLVSVAYLAVMGAVGLRVAGRRIGILLLH